MNVVKRVLFEDVHNIKLNGIALVGWIVASIWGVVSLLIEVLGAI